MYAAMERLKDYYNEEQSVERAIIEFEEKNQEKRWYFSTFNKKNNKKVIFVFIYTDEEKGIIILQQDQSVWSTTDRAEIEAEAKRLLDKRLNEIQNR